MTVFNSNIRSLSVEKSIFSILQAHIRVFRLQVSTFRNGCTNRIDLKIQSRLSVRFIGELFIEVRFFFQMMEKRTKSIISNTPTIGPFPYQSHDCSTTDNIMTPILQRRRINWTTNVHLFCFLHYQRVFTVESGVQAIPQQLWFSFEVAAPSQILYPQLVKRVLLNSSSRLKHLEAWPQSGNGEILKMSNSGFTLCFNLWNYDRIRNYLRHQIAQQCNKQVINFYFKVLYKHKLLPISNSKMVAFALYCKFTILIDEVAVVNKKLEPQKAKQPQRDTAIKINIFC